MVTRTSSVIPELKAAYFTCTACKWGQLIPVESSGKFLEPKVCGNENCKAPAVTQSHNRSVYSDKQWVKLQETPDAIPEVIQFYKPFYVLFLGRNSSHSQYVLL